MYVVSACLLGKNCKYNGGHNLNQNVLEFLTGEEYIEICPESFGELKTPRPAAEIINGDGYDVILGKAFVQDEKGKDITKEFLIGAKKCLKIALDHQAKAILKERSPSCGLKFIYDGSFSRKTRKGPGVTAAYFEQNNIPILTEEDL